MRVERTRVGVADLADLIWVEPNLTLTTVEDGGGDALLSGEVDPIQRKNVPSAFCSI